LLRRSVVFSQRAFGLLLNSLLSRGRLMRSIYAACGLALCLALISTKSSSAQSLGNPGFEDPIVSMGSAVGNWFRNSNKTYLG
jgi:hypothetical protein